MPKYAVPGTPGWFTGESHYDIGGHVDAVLALHEHGRISRAKAREEIAKCSRGLCNTMHMPWDELNFASAPDVQTAVEKEREECARLVESHIGEDGEDERPCRSIAQDIRARKS